MTPPEPIGLARRLSLLGKQSLVYGLGSVVSRFASLLLLPVYAAYLDPGDYGRVENLTALVAVAATISQLGMVNALFRFALERTGDARWAVVRTAIAFCACTGAIVAIAAALLTPLVASAILQGDHTALWLVSCVGLWVALVYEPTVGLYRVEQRPTRFLMITLVNVGVTIAASLVLGRRVRRPRVRSGRRLLHRHGGGAGGRGRRPAARAVRAARPGGAAPDAALRAPVHAGAAGALGAQPVEPADPDGAGLGGRGRRARRRRADRPGGRADGDRVPARLAAVRLRHRGGRGGPPRLPRRAHVLDAAGELGGARAGAPAGRRSSRSCRTTRPGPGPPTRWPSPPPGSASTAATTSSAWPSAGSSRPSSTGSSRASRRWSSIGLCFPFVGWWGATGAAALDRAGLRPDGDA